MKIAILSMHRIVNYGSVLQAYSLKSIIEKITGEKVDFLDIDESNCIDVKMPIRDSLDYEKNEYRKVTLFQKIKEKLNRELNKKYQADVKKFMVDVLEVNTANSSKTYDVVVVGSDEVFNSRGDKINLQLYGQIPQAKQVIAYAASCGSTTMEGIPDDKKAMIQDALNNFTAMSVRDNGTYEYVNNFYKGSINFHLDPVLMGDLYARPHKSVPLKNYMVIYAYGLRIRTKEEIRAIKNFAKKRKLKTVAIGGTQYWADLYIPMSPFRVLDYFYYADYIVTDTFHGTIFSIINHKKFVSIIRVTNRNKLTDLLLRLGLEQRMLNDISKFDSILEQEIDYSKVDGILEEKRKETYEYLRQNIMG